MADGERGREPLKAAPIDQRSFILVYRTGDQVMEGLESFCGEQGITAAALSGIGACRRATIAYFDWDTKQYEEIPVEEQVEVLSLAGNAGLFEGKPKIHAHVSLGRRDGSALGGHLVEAEVRPNLELVVTVGSAELHRQVDEETGLTLLSP